MRVLSVAVLALVGGVASAQDEFVWIPITTVESPPARSHHAMAFDEGRGVVVLFGGYDGTRQYFGDTWEYDGLAWRLRSVVGPAPRYDHAMTYDPDREVVVLFGGYGGSSVPGRVLGDLWLWDGTSWEESFEAGPEPRFDAEMTYDRFFDELVLFGGQDSPTSLPADTWTRSSAGWERHVDPSGPSPRVDHALVYDRTRFRAVLFGGDSGERLDDTWIWDGQSWSATLAAVRPAPRDEHALVYDRGRASVVLFGGHFGGRLNDLHFLDGDGWQEQFAPGPSAREDHAMAHDDVRGRTVLFGGFDGQGWLDDTWELDSVPDAPIGSPRLTLESSRDGTELSWSALGGATHYDVVHGEVGRLVDQGLTDSVIGCLADELAATTFDAMPPMSPGDVLWFLVRGSNLGGPGTYDTGNASQAGPRDAAIEAALAACP